MRIQTDSTTEAFPTKQNASTAWMPGKRRLFLSQGSLQNDEIRFLNTKLLPD